MTERAKQFLIGKAAHIIISLGYDEKDVKKEFANLLKNLNEKKKD